MKIFENLGLTWPAILFYAINLIVLVLGMYFLMFKRVKKLVQERKASLEAIHSENARLNQETLTKKHEYDKLLADTKQEVARLSQEVTLAAEQKSEALLKEAKAQADEIIRAARKDAEVEQMRLANDFKSQVGDIAVEIAGAVLSREVNAKDNKQIIEDALKRWDK